MYLVHGILPSHLTYQDISVKFTGQESQHTLAFLFRHSTQAFGVTNPTPLRLLNVPASMTTCGDNKAPPRYFQYQKDKHKEIERQEHGGQAEPLSPAGMAG
jgi:hypothetical protein